MWLLYNIFGIHEEKDIKPRDHLPYKIFRVLRILGAAVSNVLNVFRVSYGFEGFRGFHFDYHCYGVYLVISLFFSGLQYLLYMLISCFIYF